MFENTTSKVQTKQKRADTLGGEFGNNCDWGTGKNATIKMTREE